MHALTIDEDSFRSYRSPTSGYYVSKQQSILRVDCRTSDFESIADLGLAVHNLGNNDTPLDEKKRHTFQCLKY